ncbi:MAG: hypothetical protein ACOCXT_05160 [Candidatus Dojkabacteria bacterium]
MELSHLQPSINKNLNNAPPPSAELTLKVLGGVHGFGLLHGIDISVIPQHARQAAETASKYLLTGLLLLGLTACQFSFSPTTVAGYPPEPDNVVLDSQRPTNVDPTLYKDARLRCTKPDVGFIVRGDIPKRTPIVHIIFPDGTEVTLNAVPGRNLDHHTGTTVFNWTHLDTSNLPDEPVEVIGEGGMPHKVTFAALLASGVSSEGVPTFKNVTTQANVVTDIRHDNDTTLRTITTTKTDTLGLALNEGRPITVEQESVSTWVEDPGIPQRYVTSPFPAETIFTCREP